MSNLEKDLIFDDIKMTAYHGISGFENSQNIQYTRLLKMMMKKYSLNKSLDKMNINKIKDITKSDILLGSYEFLKYNWLDTIHTYSPNKDKNTAIIDGTDRFFGQIFTILETEPILNWLYTLNNDHGSLQLSFKKPEAILTKIFIRGKTCDDICRASYISNDFTYLFNSLDKLTNELDNFDYWIEDDRNNSSWNAVKIYLMRTKKEIYGKYIAFELQLITPEMLIIKNQSTNHVNYERIRLSRDPKILDLYKYLNINFDNMCDRLKINDEMCNLIEMVLNLGNFLEIKGDFVNDESIEFNEFKINHDDSTIFLDPLEDDMLIFGSYQKTPETKFQIINQKMICVGSCNHYLTKQRINIEPLKIKIKFIGTDISLQYSPFSNCGWSGIQKGQTVCFSSGNTIWIRNKIYDISTENPQVYYNNNISYIHDGDNNNTHELIVIMDNENTSYEIDGKIILKNISLHGAEILDKGVFHLGFCCWSEKPVSTILNVEIIKL